MISLKMNLFDNPFFYISLLLTIGYILSVQIFFKKKTLERMKNLKPSSIDQSMSVSKKVQFCLIPIFLLLLGFSPGVNFDIMGKFHYKKWENNELLKHEDKYLELKKQSADVIDFNYSTMNRKKQYVSFFIGEKLHKDDYVEVKPILHKNKKPVLVTKTFKNTVNPFVKKGEVYQRILYIPKMYNELLKIK
jgi:hypothetical protein